MPRVCVFDVNETLLDMSALDTNFKDLFGNQDVRTMWFGQVIQSALVATVTDSYTPLSEVSASADGQDSILGAMRTLPAHTEVAESLTLNTPGTVRDKTGSADELDRRGSGRSTQEHWNCSVFQPDLVCGFSSTA
jgi:hypothetical protein